MVTLRRLRWLAIIVPVLLIGVVEVLSDTLLDEALHFPLDAVAVVLVVLLAALIWSSIAFGLIDRQDQLLREQNAALAARNATTRALHAMTASIGALADVDAVLRTSAANARSLLGADSALIVLVGADGEERLAATSGPDAAFDESGSQPGSDGGPGAEGRRFLRAAFAGSYLAAPLQRGATTIGTLGVGTVEPRSLGLDEVETLGSLAAQAAIAIENDRLQRELRGLAIHAERERIAREMHDGLAQVLGYVNTKSQAVEELLALGRTDEAQVQLRELASAARSTYVDVREAILGLTTPLAGYGTSEGFGGALETYARRFADASKLAVNVQVDGVIGWDELAPEVMANLLRIVQEALTNVRKHAAAQRVAIHLARDGAGIAVTVEDDGRGFDPDAPDVATGWPHFGRETIRQRAAAIGGTVRWDSAPGRGTRLRVEVPA